MTGTKYGTMIVPGDPEFSNLMWLLDWRASPPAPHAAWQEATAGSVDSRHLNRVDAPCQRQPPRPPAAMLSIEAAGRSRVARRLLDPEVV
jgi:hypothetical protein